MKENTIGFQLKETGNEETGNEETESNKSQLFSSKTKTGKLIELSIFLIILILTLISVIIATSTMILITNDYTVTHTYGDSMEPVINETDTYTITIDIDSYDDEIQEGDIVSFETDCSLIGEKNILHEIIATDSNGEYITYGINNNGTLDQVIKIHYEEYVFKSRNLDDLLYALENDLEITITESSCIEGVTEENIRGIYVDNVQDDTINNKIVTHIKEITTLLGI